MLQSEASRVLNESASPSLEPAVARVSQVSHDDAFEVQADMLVGRALLAELELSISSPVSASSIRCQYPPLSSSVGTSPSAHRLSSPWHGLESNASFAPSFEEKCRSLGFLKTSRVIKVNCPLSYDSELLSTMRARGLEIQDCLVYPCDEQFSSLDSGRATHILFFDIRHALDAILLVQKIDAKSPSALAAQFFDSWDSMLVNVGEVLIRGLGGKIGNDFRSLLETYGSVRSLEEYSKMAICVVEYFDVRSAEAAVQGLNGRLVENAFLSATLFNSGRSRSVNTNTSGAPPPTIASHHLSGSQRGGVKGLRIDTAGLSLSSALAGLWSSRKETHDQSNGFGGPMPRSAPIEKTATLLNANPSATSSKINFADDGHNVCERPSAHAAMTNSNFLSPDVDLIMHLTGLFNQRQRIAAAVTDAKEQAEQLLSKERRHEDLSPGSASSLSDQPPASLPPVAPEVDVSLTECARSERSGTRPSASLRIDTARLAPPASLGSADSMGRELVKSHSPDPKLDDQPSSASSARSASSYAGVVARYIPSGLSPRGEVHAGNEVVPADILSGKDLRTTVMLKNVPNRYSQDMLIRFINKTHLGKYDFLYLRMDFLNKCNVGYAFIKFDVLDFVCLILHSASFVDGRSLVSFSQRINGRRWPRFGSEKIPILCFANIQSKQKLIEKFRNSSVMQENPAYRPKIFKSDGTEDIFPGPSGAIRQKSTVLFSRDGYFSQYREGGKIRHLQQSPIPMSPQATLPSPSPSPFE